MQLEVVSSQPVGIEHPVPLLFVHGMYHAAWNWNERFLPYFASRGYRAHALSLRGHGGSEKPTQFNKTRISDYVDDVVQVVDMLGVPPVLIGHSMGGYVVQKYLEGREIPAAVLVASSPPGLEVWMSAFEIMRLTPLGFMRAAFTFDLYEAVKTSEQYHRLFFSDDFPRAQVEQYHRRLNGESYRAFFDMLGLNPVRPKQIKAPLMVLGSRADRIITANQVKHTARTYGVEPVFVDGLGHNLPLDASWQQVADRIIGWLEQNGI